MFRIFCVSAAAATKQQCFAFSLPLVTIQCMLQARRHLLATDAAPMHALAAGCMHAESHQLLLLMLLLCCLPYYCCTSTNEQNSEEVAER